MLPKVLLYYTQAARNYGLSADRLQEHKQRKLARSMRWAYEHVPLYHQRFKQLGKGPQDFERVEQLTGFPTLSKAEVMRMGRDSLRARGVRIAVSWGTTGTSGDPFIVEYSEEMNDVRAAMALRRLTGFGVRPWSRLVSIWPPKVRWRYGYYESGQARPSTTYLDLPVASFYRRPFPTARILVSNPVDLRGESRALKGMEPDFIVGRASHLRQVAIQLQNDGIGIHLHGLFLTGEPSTAATMRLLSESFHAPVCRMYGCTEGGNLGGDCKAQRGLHLYEDFMIFEVLRNGEQVGPGETGELALTTLHNDAMPLIRYKTGDLVKRADGDRCECGSYLMRLDSVQGRTGDGLMTASGERRPAMLVAEEIERRTGLTDFQVNQMGMDRIEVRLAHGQTLDDRQAEELTSWLSGLVGVEQTVTFAQRGEEELWEKARPVTSAVG